jgi:hypothetical protein
LDNLSVLKSTFGIKSLRTSSKMFTLAVTESCRKSFCYNEGQPPNPRRSLRSEVFGFSSKVSLLSVLPLPSPAAPPTIPLHSSTLFLRNRLFVISVIPHSLLLLSEYGKLSQRHGNPSTGGSNDPFCRTFKLV